MSIYVRDQIDRKGNDVRRLSCAAISDQVFVSIFPILPLDSRFIPPSLTHQDLAPAPPIGPLIPGGNDSCLREQWRQRSTRNKSSRLQDSGVRRERNNS